MPTSSSTLLQAVLATVVVLAIGQVHAVWPSAGLRLQIGGPILIGVLLLALVGLARRPSLVDRLTEEARAPTRRALALVVAGVGVAVVSPQLAVRIALLLAGWAVWVRGHGQHRARWAWWVVLGLAVVVRVSFVVGFPRPLWSADTLSYVRGVHLVLTGSELLTDPERTPVFPLYVAGILGVSRSYFVYLLVAHSAGLLSALAVGLSLRRRYGELAGWLAFAVLALSARLIFFEHMLRSEHVFLVVLCGLVVALTRWLGDDRAEEAHVSAGKEVGLGAGVGLLVGLAILARPVALALPPVVLLATLARRRRVAPVAAVVLGLAAPLLLTASYNKVEHGFFGLTRIGSYALFGAAGHLVDPDSVGHEEVKGQMRSRLADHNARRPYWRPDFNWLVYGPRGPLDVPALQRLTEPERNRVVGELARQAALTHPLQFSIRTSYEVGLFLVQPHRHYLVPASHLEPFDPLAQSEAQFGPTQARTFFRPGEVSPARQTVYTVGAHLLTRVYSLLPFELFDHLLFALAVLIATWRRTRDRILLAALALCPLVLAAPVCLLNAVLPRYHVQAVPFLAVAGGILAAGWLERARAESAPEASPLPA